jgi:hypothetical protein
VGGTGKMGGLCLVFESKALRMNHVALPQLDIGCLSRRNCA